MKALSSTCSWFFLTFLMTPIFCFATDPQQYDAVYKLKYADTSKSNCLNIQGYLKGNEHGKMVLKLPSHGEKVSFSSPKGLNYRFKAENVCEVNFVPNENVIFDYNICVDNANHNIELPIIESTLFHVKTNHILIIPEADEKEVKKIKFYFNEMPQHFNLVSSFSANQRETETTQSIIEFQNSVIAGAASPIKTIYIQGYPVYIVSHGRWPYFEKGVNYYLEKLITTHREFWNDYNFSHYVIFLMPAPEGGKFVRGVHHENMISAVIPESAKKEKLSKALILLSHELFHTWLGMGIKIPHPQGNLQWLFEGVTDYYAIQMALRSGLITNEHIVVINSFMEDYYASPLLSISNKELARNYSPYNSLDNLSEVRGYLTFLKFLPHQSEGQRLKNFEKNPLDDVLREIYKKYKGRAISEQEVDRLFEKHFGNEKWNEIKEHLIFGKELSSDPKLFKKEALLINKSKKVPTQGFDINPKTGLKKIAHLDPKSNAYKAGLRNGQEVVKYSLSFADSSVLSKILIKEGKEIKLISYYPNETTKMIPQYELFAENKLAVNDFNFEVDGLVNDPQ